MIKVKSLIEFDDYQGKDTQNTQNEHIHRKVGDIFEVTEERYNFLKSKGAVELIGIDKAVETVDKPVEKSKKGRKKKDGI